MMGTRGAVPRKRKAVAESIALDEHEAAASMDLPSTGRVLRLLARWAVRRTQKRGGQQEDLMKEVTLDETKG